MKKFFLIFFIVIGISLLYSEEVRYKPYVLAGIEKGEMTEAVTKVENMLTENGFEVLGKYSPLQDKNMVVLVVTHEILQKTAGKFLDKYDGLVALAAVSRFALCKVDENIEVSYRNPLYWGNAYFQKDFPAVEKDYNVLNLRIVEMCKGLSEIKNSPYGSEKGETVKKLRKFRFGIFMPYFDDVVTLAKNIDRNAVMKTAEENLAKKMDGNEKVYSLDFPGKNLTLYGIALFDEFGEKFFYPILSKKKPNLIPLLPWDILVMKDKVVVLNGKYFMSLAFPDVGFGTFLKVRKCGKYTPRSFKRILGVAEK